MHIMNPSAHESPVPADSHSSEHAGIIIPPPFVYAAAFLLAWWLHRRVPLLLFPVSSEIASAARVVLMWASGLTGVALVVYTRMLFIRAGTSVFPNRPTTALVRSGPYRFSRNPMYVSLSLITLALAFLLNTAWLVFFLALAVALVDRTIIQREERYLERRFGDAYRAYCARVRRWI
ncbi:MAG: isoprenylcysteine carboxylmethyltransferase family protein [Luteitalea sp.]|nr:isoprenylcysteine carboxylmethyltransferase family protein [Luteitalea sp.]